MSFKIILILLFTVYLNYLNLHFLVTTTHSHISHKPFANIIILRRLNLGQTFQQNGTASEAVRRLQLVGDPIDANEAQRPCPRKDEWHRARMC
jgi:hypothetical protein